MNLSLVISALTSLGAHADAMDMSRYAPVALIGLLLVPFAGKPPQALGAEADHL
jgi:hypothetical protein